MMLPGALFAFDSSRQLLVFATAPGQFMGITAHNLRQAGWEVSEAGLRASLPRFGQQLHIAPDMASARAMAGELGEATRAAQVGLNGRRRRDK